MNSKASDTKEGDDKQTRAYIHDMIVQLAIMAAKIGDDNFANALLALVEQSTQPSRH